MKLIGVNMKFFKKSLEKKLEEQIGMILNTNKNTSGNYNNVIDFFEISKKVIVQMLVDKNDISKQELELIDNSLSNSIELARLEISSINLRKKRILVEKLLDNLTTNKNSFLVQPIGYTMTHHRVSALIRKKDDCSYTFMINDKSQQNRKNSEKMYTEYTTKNIEDLIDVMLNPRVRCLDYLNMRIERDENFKIKIRTIFQAPVHYNIPTTPQIIGNCFLKEIEFGIKNAIMTRKHSFNYIEREGESIKNILKLDSEEFHIRYVKELLEKYKNKVSSDFVVKINNQIETYHENKVFIRNIKNFLKENIEKNSFSFAIEVKKELPKILMKSFNSKSFKDAFEKQNYSSIYKTIETGMLFINAYGEKQGIDRAMMYKMAMEQLCKEYTKESGKEIGVYKELLAVNGKMEILGPLSKNSIKSYLNDREI